MKITDIVALIGCVTGVLGLGLSLLIYFEGMAKFKIEFPTDFPNLFFKKLKNYSYTITEKHAIIYIRFINNSNKPLTIYDIQSFVKNEELHFTEYGPETINNPSDDSLTDKIVLEDRLLSGELIGETDIDMKKQISLPLTIPPYGVNEGYMFYQFFPNIITNSVTVNFKVKTSRKSKTSKTEVYQYNYKENNK